jgi:hypothetical protein
MLLTVRKVWLREKIVLERDPEVDFPEANIIISENICAGITEKSDQESDVTFRLKF